jgi:hypothetical protein
VLWSIGAGQEEGEAKGALRTTLRMTAWQGGKGGAGTAADRLKGGTMTVKRREGGGSGAREDSGAVAALGRRAAPAR